jgi:hypothetical protein
MNEAFSYEDRDGVLIGPIRSPKNSAKHLGAGSIHDDATAQKLGFRGGTVAGSLHMEQFPPLLVAAFGDDWLRTGGLSLYFKYATTDNEPVQAFVQAPEADGRRTEVWMDDAAGHRVADGTANLGGPDPDSTLRQRLAAMPEPEDLRILADVKAGTAGERLPTRISEEALANRLAVITEPLPAYTDPSIYGERIATPALQVQVMRPGERSMLPRNGDYGVGLFGAIELQLHDGPVFVEHDYECQSTVLAVGETPKTEYLYYEATLHEPGSEAKVLSMIMMLRFMKASSGLWQ